MNPSPILVSRHGRVGVITLHRPAQLNALNDALMDALGAALLAFDADDLAIVSAHAQDAVFTIGPYSFRPSSKLLTGQKGNKVRLTEKETAILRYANTLMPQMPDMSDRATAMWKEDNKQAANASAYDAWHPPAFGITTAGMKLMAAVDMRQNKLKGRPLRAA